MAQLITFLHLSDIHFSKRDRSSLYELDEGLRREIEHDSRTMASELGGVTGILVSGDVAFAGTPSEYANASSWLAELSTGLGVPAENIWVVPGNHDINWAIQDTDEIGISLRHTLRTVPLSDLDERLESILTDSDASSHVFDPLRHYQTFAADYDCLTNPERVAWSARVDLGPYVILLRGVNSVLVSDRSDDPAEAPLVVGRNQTQLLRDEGVVHLTICHHPRTWIRDGDACMQDFDNRAVVQLTGHDHRYQTTVRGNSVCIAAGAAHPPRKEPNWEPRYNFVVLELVERPSPLIKVNVYSRVWNPSKGQFEADSPSTVSHEFVLDDVTAIEQVGQDLEEESLNDPDEQYPHGVPDQRAEVIANRGRHLAHRLALLRSGDRRSIAVAIGVPISAMARKRPDEIVELIMEYAKEQDKLRELWEAVDSAHGMEIDKTNPYSTGGGTDGG